MTQPKQSSRPLTPDGIKTRADRMAEQCYAIGAYANAIAMGDPDPQLLHYIARTAKRLSFAAHDLSDRASQ